MDAASHATAHAWDSCLVLIYCYYYFRFRFRKSSWFGLNAAVGTSCFPGCHGDIPSPRMMRFLYYVKWCKSFRLCFCRRCFSSTLHHKTDQKQMSIRSVRRGPAKRIKPSRGLPVSTLVCLWGTFPAFVVSEVWTVFIWQRTLKRLNTVQRQRCARSILLLQRAWTDKWWDVTLLKYTFTLLYFCCLLIPLDYILDANIAFCSFFIALFT